MSYIIWFLSFIFRSRFKSKLNANLPLVWTNFKCSVNKYITKINSSIFLTECTNPTYNPCPFLNHKGGGGADLIFSVRLVVLCCTCVQKPCNLNFQQRQPVLATANFNLKYIDSSFLLDSPSRPPKLTNQTMDLIFQGY